MGARSGSDGLQVVVPLRPQEPEVLGLLTNQPQSAATVRLPPLRRRLKRVVMPLHHGSDLRRRCQRLKWVVPLHHGSDLRRRRCQRWYQVVDACTGRRRTCAPLTASTNIFGTQLPPSRSEAESGAPTARQLVVPNAAIQLAATALDVVSNGWQP